MIGEAACGKRILIINPNTSEHITQMMVREASRLVPEGVEVLGQTAPFGSPSLECLAELVVAGHAVLTVLADHADCDAAIIGAFGDPGLAAAQDTMPMPVFGLGRSGLRAASDEGRRRFAMVTVGPHMQASLEQAAREAGVHDALAGITFMSASVLELARDPGAFRPLMLDIARGLAADHGAQAVLFAGAPFSGIGSTTFPNVGVPLFDGLTSAVSAALAAPARSREPPVTLHAPKSMVGIAENLAAMIGMRLHRV